jgi:hypothetical protein
MEVGLRHQIVNCCGLPSYSILCTDSQQLSIFLHSDPSMWSFLAIYRDICRYASAGVSVRFSETARRPAPGANSAIGQHHP